MFPFPSILAVAASCISFLLHFFLLCHRSKFSLSFLLLLLRNFPPSPPPPLLPLPICHRFQVGTGRLNLKKGRQHYKTCPTVLKYVAEWETFIFLAILRHTSRPFVLGSTLILLLQRRHREKEKEEKKNKEPEELRQWTFQQPKAKRRLRGPRGKEKTKTIFHWLLLLFQPLNNWFREISISPKKREKLPAHKIAGTTFFSWKTCVKARKKRG